MDSTVLEVRTGASEAVRDLTRDCEGFLNVLPALISPSLTLPVFDGRMALGTWQSVALVDLNVDNAVRQVRLSFLEG